MTPPRIHRAGRAGRLLRRRVAPIAVLALVAACGDDAPDRAAVVATIADDVAVPGYRTFDARARALATAAETVCAELDEPSLAEARQALASTREAWRLLEAVSIGPVMAHRSWALVDWPVDDAEIEELLADPSRGPLDADYLAVRVAAGNRGLGAVELLLHPDVGDARAGLADARRCEYLVGLTGVVRDEAEHLLAEWVDDAGDGLPYRDVLVGETDAMTPSESIDELVNEMLTMVDDSVERELGIALGTTAAEADPTVIVEGGGGFGVLDQRARADSLRAVLVGADGESGLGPLLGDDLVERLRAEIDAVVSALGAIDGSLTEAITARPGAVTAVFDAWSALRVTLHTEVVSRLGVTVGFSDADGDSAG